MLRFRYLQKRPNANRIVSNALVISILSDKLTRLWIRHMLCRQQLKGQSC
jgi:hypothetical protein